MAQDDALKRLYADFPKLKDKSFESLDDFKKFRSTNPEIPESVWDILTPIQQPLQAPQEATTANKPHEGQKSHLQHSAHEGPKPIHDIEEDFRYKNIVNNHIQDWNRQNPQNKFSGKAFVKDDTGKIILNPDLKRAIPNIHDQAVSTMRIGFGDKEVDKYKNYESHRVYKNRLQDPTYSALIESKNPLDYDAYVTTHYEKSLGYARKDKELRKAISRRDKSVRDERKAQDKAIKKIYKNPEDDPLLQKTKADIDKDTEVIYQEQLELQKQSGKPNPVDREEIRRKIHQQKYEEFIKNNEKKARKYAKKNPELQTELQAYDIRQKDAKASTKNRNKAIKKLKKNSDPNKDFRIQELESEINNKLIDHSYLPQNKLEEKTREIRQNAYNDFARNNKELAEKYSKTSLEFRSAKERVTKTQEMANPRGLGYKLKNIFKKSSPTPISQTPTTSTKASPPTLTLEEWKKRLSSLNSQQKEKEEERDRPQNSNPVRTYKRIKSYLRPADTSGVAQSTSTPPRQNGFGSRFRPRSLRPRPPAASAEAEKIAANFGKQAVMTGLRAAAPYLLLALIIIIVVLLFILIIWYLVHGSKRNNNDFKISVSKTGPPSVNNPTSDTDAASQIPYKITVNYSGAADKIVVTDIIPDNAAFVSAGQNAKTYDASGAVTTDPNLVKKVLWEITLSGSSGNSTPVCGMASPSEEPWPAVNQWNTQISSAINLAKQTEKIDVPGNLVKAIMMMESAGVELSPNDVTDYRGLMQVSEKTARADGSNCDWNNKPTYDVNTTQGNVNCGVQHLARGLIMCGGDPMQTIGQYFTGGCDYGSAGPDGYGTTPDAYVNKVIGTYNYLNSVTDPAACK